VKEDLKAAEGTSRNGYVHFTNFTLGNGLKVILSRDNSIPSIAINVCYHVGSKDEDTNKRGFAHLFEHLMFEGSPNLKPGEYDRICTSAGGENNAYTNEDKTNYFILLPSHQLELGLWLESDRMLDFALTKKSFNTQKSVVSEEKNQVFDNRPYGTVSLEFMPKLFHSSGYAWDTIGDMNDLKAAKLEDAHEFYNKFYVPSNAVVTIVGDIDIDKTKILTEKYFGTINRTSSIQRKPFEEKPLAQETRKTILDNVQIPGVFWAYRTPKENSKEFFSLDMLCDILSSGESSRLYKRLIYEKQLASEAGCYIDPKEFTSIVYFYAILMPGIEISTVEDEIESIIAEISEGKIEESELQKVKNKVETRNAYRKQTLLARADLLSHFGLMYNNPDLINTNVQNYFKVTLNSITETTRKYLVKNNRVVLHYIPQNGIPKKFQ